MCICTIVPFHSCPHGVPPEPPPQSLSSPFSSGTSNPPLGGRTETRVASSPPPCSSQGPGPRMHPGISLEPGGGPERPRVALLWWECLQGHPRAGSVSRVPGSGVYPLVLVNRSPIGTSVQGSAYTRGIALCPALWGCGTQVWLCSVNVCPCGPAVPHCPASPSPGRKRAEPLTAPSDSGKVTQEQLLGQKVHSHPSHSSMARSHLPLPSQAGLGSLPFLPRTPPLPVGTPQHPALPSRPQSWNHEELVARYLSLCSCPVTGQSTARTSLWTAAWTPEHKDCS